MPKVGSAHATLSSPAGARKLNLFISRISAGYFRATVAAKGVMTLLYDNKYAHFHKI
jgi:hypothetical protein